VDDVSTLRRILKENQVIAVVGLSADWFRPSFFAAKYMLEHGYRVIPVNPKYPEILGQKCYKSLQEIPGKVGIVDIFRKSQDVMPIAEAAIAIGARVLWQQLGVRNEAAAAKARAAGLESVQDRCVKIEHARLFGGLGWVGVNTGPCCVGNLGSAQRFAYSAIGDTVNVAARLEAQTKFYGVPILIGEATRAAVPGFAALEVDHLRAAGRDEATRLYALLGDERMVDAKFASMRQAHEAMLQFYRDRRWEQAAEIAGALAIALPAMATVYATYEARVRAFAAEPPPPGWDGTVIADSE